MMVTRECFLPVLISINEPFAIFCPPPFHLRRGEKNKLGGHSVASQGQPIPVSLLWRLWLFLTRHILQAYSTGDRGTRVILSVLHSYSSPTCLYGLIFTQNYRFAPKILAFEQYWIVQRLILKGTASLFSHLSHYISCGSCCQNWALLFPLWVCNRHIQSRGFALALTVRQKILEHKSSLSLGSDEVLCQFIFSCV